MKLVEIPNGSLKQYYYDVIKELHDIGIDDISTTGHFLLWCAILLWKGVRCERMYWLFNWN